MSMHNPTQQFKRALMLHQSGNLEGAEQEYKRILKAHPKHADALRMLGMLYLQQGQWEEGERLTAAAIRSEPNHPEAHNNRGYALQNLGRNEEALACYDRAVKLYSPYAGAWYNRGNVLQKMQRYGDAVSSYRQALVHMPGYSDAWVNLGNTYKLMQHYEDALSCYEKAIAINPQHAVAYNNLGNTLRELKRLDAALENFGKAVQVQPLYGDAYFNAATTLRELGRYGEAVTSYRKVIELKPDRTDAYLNLGSVLREMKKYDEALNNYDMAISLDSGDHQAYVLKAELLAELGRMAEAEESVNRSLEIAPDETASLRVLLSLVRYREDDPRFSRFEALYTQRHSMPPDDRIRLNFIMGKAMEDAGKYDLAFSAYEEGNRLVHLEHPFDEVAEDLALEQTIASFTRELFEQSARLAELLPPVADERIPIFIVGMPRSGTTLIEQILASHPALFGAGELMVLDEICERINLPSPSASNWKESLLYLRQLGQEYLDRVWKLAPNARYITDKMPANFLSIGLIHLMLPNAKIVHVMREPLDSCISCYTLRFAEKHYYSYDLGTLGRYCRRYQKLMKHWHDVLPPGRILDVRYEDTVTDVEGQARRLLDYLGIPWDPSCLKFYETRRPVATASVTQVRKPIYSNSVGRWKRFEKHLDPLIEIIHAAD